MRIEARMTHNLMLQVPINRYDDIPYKTFKTTIKTSFTMRQYAKQHFI